MQKFWIKGISKAHAQSGLTVYRVQQDLDMNYNTVQKYVTRDIVTERLPPEIEKLAAYYGLDWRDPNVVSVIEVEDEEDTANLLAVIA